MDRNREHTMKININVRRLLFFLSNQWKSNGTFTKRKIPRKKTRNQITLREQNTDETKNWGEQIIWQRTITPKSANKGALRQMCLSWIVKFASQNQSVSLVNSHLDNMYFFHLFAIIVIDCVKNKLYLSFLSSFFVSLYECFFFLNNISMFVNKFNVISVFIS